MTRQLNDFKRLQQIVNEVVDKQNAEFRNYAGFDEDEPRQLITAPVLQVTDQGFETTTNSTNDLMRLIGSLEKFTDEIVGNKIFWVEPVLKFFDIQTSSYEGTQLLAQREKYVQTQGILPSRSNVKHRGSYTNKEDLENEIEEESPSAKGK